MKDKKNILAIIPARSGSKGIKLKNIKLFCDKPLISWTINKAKKISKIDKIIVSTDDGKIAKIAKSLDVEVPFIRPKKYSKDDSPGIDVVLHALSYFKDYKYILLLQPTSPLRSIRDINGIINFTLKNNLKSTVSISKVREYPQLMYKISKEKKLTKEFIKYSSFNIRQEYEALYRINGALYMSDSKWILKNKTLVSNDTYGYIMPVERSADLDDTFDWKIAEMLSRKNSK